MQIISASWQSLETCRISLPTTYSNLAKVGVEGSNPFARSRFLGNRGLFATVYRAFASLDLASASAQLVQSKITPNSQVLSVATLERPRFRGMCSGLYA